MRTRLLVALGVLGVALPALGRDDEWPQFRGPDGSGSSGARQVPTEWSADKGVAWKAKLPGYGWSSPVVWGDKVFVTTAVSDKQKKPSGGFGPGEPGGPGGFPSGPRAGQLLPAFLQEALKLTGEQKERLAALQKDVDGRLAKVLTEEQAKQFGEPRPGGFGRGGFGGFPQPGQVLTPAVQERLKLTAEQKKQAEELQKYVDAALAKTLTADQQKQLKEMRAGPGGPGRGGFGRGGTGRPPDADYQLEVRCLDRATGKVLWKRTAYDGKPRIPTQASNTYATETVVTDGERVYAYFGMHGVYCFDLHGNPVWKADLGAYPTAMGHGTGSSPALADGRLFIQCDNEQKSFLAALDAKTGKELWRISRSERTGYSTPLIWKNKTRTEVVCLGSPRVRSYDPATGKQLWELGGMSGQPKASPVADTDLLYVGTGGGFGGRGGRGGSGDDSGGGGGRPLVAVKAGASGDITPKEGQNSSASIAWHLSQGGPQTASPLLYKGYLYVLEDRGGLLSCYDARTGEKIYKERLSGARGFTSSPWACNDKVFCLDDGGTTYVVQAGASFKVLARNPLGEMCWASPAVANGAVFLRSVDCLYCIAAKEGK